MLIWCAHSYRTKHIVVETEAEIIKMMEIEIDEMETERKGLVIGLIETIADAVILN